MKDIVTIIIVMLTGLGLLFVPYLVNLPTFLVIAAGLVGLGIIVAVVNTLIG